MENLKYNPGKGYRMVKRGARGGKAYKKRGAYRGRKSVARRRQPVKAAKRGLPKRQLIQSSLGGLTMSRFVATRMLSGVAKHIVKVGAPNFVNITYPGVIQQLGGFQTNSSWFLSAGNDLRRIWTTTQGIYTRENGTTFAEYASDLSGNTNYNASFRIVLQSAISQLNIANTSGTPCNIELYDIVAKRDIGQLPTKFDGSLAIGGGKYGQGTLMLDPGTAWDLGMRNENLVATGFETAALVADGVLSSPKNLGATPYQSKLFKDYFKVVRKTNISLPIGGQHKHYVDLKPNTVFDNDMLQQNNVFKGVSHFTMIVASGVPVVRCPDADVEHPLANPIGDSTTSAVSLSVIQQVRYKWTWVEDSREHVYRANYINSLNTNASQSVQPAMCKVTNASGDTGPQTVVAGTTYPELPSECTR